MRIPVEINVQNLPDPEQISQYPYMIVSCVDGEFWYFGADYDLEKCNQITKEFPTKITIKNPFYESSLDGHQVNCNIFSVSQFENMLKESFGVKDVIISINANNEVRDCILDGKRMLVEDIKDKMIYFYHICCDIILVRNSVVYLM